ncbi:GNAT family N-acetyltransferase [Halobacteriales archaeon QS_1_68_17]|nr:MAG: GNAT family N-acetyltransferase [Halobacteriales archaeon QS_1_68_17]
MGADRTVRRATTGGERADALAVRRRVFVEEQGVPADLERDDHDDDPGTVHFVAYRDGEPIGAARLRPVGPATGKVERVAVLSRVRGEGLGRALMDAVESTAAAEGLATLTLHAQRHVEAFYRRLGYETVSGEFAEAGIPHVEMEKPLPPPD